MNDKYKKMRDYTREEFINLIEKMNLEELKYFSSNFGGYPVLFRMSLDERVCHIPFIQTGSSIIVEYENKILLQERKDKNIFGLPGGCQELGEKLEETAIRELFEETNIKCDSTDLILINTLSGESRKNSYPNGDVVYNNTSLFLLKACEEQVVQIKKNEESISLKFCDLNDLPDNLMDKDLINSYLEYKETQKVIK